MKAHHINGNIATHHPFCLWLLYHTHSYKPYDLRPHTWPSPAPPGTTYVLEEVRPIAGSKWCSTNTLDHWLVQTRANCCCVCLSGQAAWLPPPSHPPVPTPGPSRLWLVHLFVPTPGSSDTKNLVLFPLVPDKWHNRYKDTPGFLSPPFSCPSSRGILGGIQ